MLRSNTSEILYTWFGYKFDVISSCRQIQSRIIWSCSRIVALYRMLRIVVTHLISVLHSIVFRRPTLPLMTTRCGLDTKGYIQQQRLVILHTGRLSEAVLVCLSRMGRWLPHSETDEFVCVMMLRCAWAVIGPRSHCTAASRQQS